MCNIFIYNLLTKFVIRVIFIGRVHTFVCSLDCTVVVVGHSWTILLDLMFVCEVFSCTVGLDLV